MLSWRLPASATVQHCRSGYAPSNAPTGASCCLGVIILVRYPSLIVPTHTWCCAVNRYLSLAQAQSKAFVVDWTDPINKPVTPSFIGTKAFAAFPIEDVLEYIDWNPFFQVSLGPGRCGERLGGKWAPNTKYTSGWT